MIDTITHYISLLITIVGAFTILLLVFELIIDKMSTTFKFFAYLIEYIWYKKEFKQWVKNKERHPKLKDNEHT